MRCEWLPATIVIKLDTDPGRPRPFGVYRRSSAVGNPFGFAGGWLVSGNYEVGEGQYRSVKQLWYFWNRHYEPEYLLRWLQPDPIGPWGDRSNGGNSYSYLAHSPADAIDSSGLGLGVFFGGTGSGKGNSPRLFSTLQRIWNQYGGEGDKKIAILEGTDIRSGMLGNGIEDYIEDIANMICYIAVCPHHQDRSKADQVIDGSANESLYGIDLFGYSRGAVVAMAVAHLLNERGCRCRMTCDMVQIRPVGIRFLGLVDPVSNASSVKDEWIKSIPANVGHRTTWLANDASGGDDILFPNHRPDYHSNFIRMRRDHIGLADSTTATALIKHGAMQSGVPFDSKAQELLEWKLVDYDRNNRHSGQNWRTEGWKNFFERERDTQWWK